MGFDIRLKKKKTSNIKDSPDLNITNSFVNFEPELKKKFESPSPLEVS
jgi:hypothetical protein